MLVALNWVLMQMEESWALNWGVMVQKKEEGWREKLLSCVVKNIGPQILGD